jgi:hypothetical protein
MHPTHSFASNSQYPLQPIPNGRLIMRKSMHVLSTQAKREFILQVMLNMHISSVVWFTSNFYNIAAHSTKRGRFTSACYYLTAKHGTNASKCDRASLLVSCNHANATPRDLFSSFSTTTTTNAISTSQFLRVASFSHASSFFANVAGSATVGAIPTGKLRTYYLSSIGKLAYPVNLWCLQVRPMVSQSETIFPSNYPNYFPTPYHLTNIFQVAGGRAHMGRKKRRRKR